MIRGRASIAGGAAKMAGNSTFERRRRGIRMRGISIVVLVALSCTSAVRAADVATATGGKMFAIAIHGGAGTLSRSDMSAQQEQDYRAGLSQALDAGYAVLGRSGT